MTDDYTHNAIYLAASGVSVAELARATGASSGEIEAWLERSRRPEGEAAERLIELMRVVSAAEGITEPQTVAEWLREPLPALGGEVPLDLVARRDYERVVDYLRRLDEQLAL